MTFEMYSSQDLSNAGPCRSVLLFRVNSVFRDPKKMHTKANRNGEANGANLATC
jgi:hypothetical protein